MLYNLWVKSNKNVTKCVSQNESLVHTKLQCMALCLKGKAFTITTSVITNAYCLTKISCKLNCHNYMLGHIDALGS